MRPLVIHSICKHKYLYLIFFCSLVTTVSSGQIQEAFEAKFARHARTHPSSLLYVHNDKTIYTNNETIWFSGYLVKAEGSLAKDHMILSVALIREDTRKIELENKYVMEDGLSFGSLILPDSIPPGNYQFIASTNVLDKEGKPLAVFTQPLTLKSITQQDFTAELSLLDTVVSNGVVRAKVTVSVKYPDPKKKQKVSLKYSVGKNEQQSVELAENTYTITIPATQLNHPQPVLLTTFTYNKQQQHLSLKLPEVRSQGINVRFFPEGGNLVAGQESTVGWEARTSQDLPIALTGILYEDNRSIDTLTTTSYGTGRFRLTPNQNHSYKLKIVANPYLSRDTTCQLPKAISAGVTLHLDEAIVNDTLRLTLTGKETETVQAVIHNYRKQYAILTLKPKPSGRKLSLALGPQIPKGLASITILDTQGRPLAERLFFVHYDQHITADIQAGKQLYNRKEQVNLKLKLTDKAGNPVQGILSAAVVQDNRLESSKWQDMESYTYLVHDLGTLPQNPLGRSITSKDYLEDMLLIKAWRRYTWQNVMDSTKADTSKHAHIQSPSFHAQLRYNNKPLKKAGLLSMLNGSNIGVVTTQDDGTFTLEPEQLVAREGQKIYISVNEDNTAGYTIRKEEPFAKINERLAGEMEINSRGIASIQNTQNQTLGGMERVIALQTVVVQDKQSDDSIFGISSGPNACGDYVCISGFLNCPNHTWDSRNTKPKKGERYKIPSKSEQVLYIGCTAEESKANLFKIDGIYTAREFYGVSSDPADLTMPQFLSTLYWQPGVVTNSSGETGFSFYTGDITGKFRVVVQGIGAQDVIYGESSFTVK